ncbi:activating signal cointegrator 1 complex subunit [Coemansia biformis]|uniref:Activating signal cointegrator 1 complex subunit n=1 Tax=Coemansia biformis TaxID=1286918 RepID=A0A9W8CZQ2_9FUNG|nr:activating signal cointegrator 1 complex subunit [Coemansia biformis]
MPKLRFPKLGRMAMSGCPADCTILSRGIFPQSMRRIALLGAAHAAVLLANTALNAVDELTLTVVTADGGRCSSADFMRATNLLFGSTCARTTSTLSLCESVALVDPAEIAWHSLGKLTINDGTDASVLLAIMGKATSITELVAFHISIDMTPCTVSRLLTTRDTQLLLLGSGIERLRISYAEGTDIETDGLHFSAFIMAKLCRLKLATFEGLSHPTMKEISIVEVGSRRYRVRTGLAGSVGGYSSRFQEPQGGDGPSAARQGKSERLSINVPRQLHKFLIGSGGSTIEWLREQSRAKITVPAERSKSDMVVVEGLPDERTKAQVLIAQIVDANISKVPYTHFVSIPIADQAVQRKVGEFQRDAEGGLLRAVASSSFVRPGSLHITLGMLRLLTPADVAEAVKLLKSLEEDIRQLLGSRPLVVKIGQLAAMESDPAKARVIYARAEDFEDQDKGRLQRLCYFVRDRFDREGYIDEKRELKIHVSLVRAKPARGSEASGAETDGGFTVNAAPLLREFGALSFGVSRLGQVQIARRFRHTENGAYESDGSVPLP